MKKLVIPKQHGAWAMLLIPFLLGVFTGNPRFEHLLLLIGWTFLYLSTYPLLMAIKGRKKDFYRGWFFKYFLFALLFIIYPVIIDYKLIYFGIILLPFFAINMHFSKVKKERAFLNDVSAIVVFCLAGVASYYFGTASIDSQALAIFVHSLLFFLGSTLYIKTMIREKKSMVYKYISWSYHIGLLIVFIFLGAYSYLFAYIPSAFRAIFLYGKTFPIKKIGIYEIINSVLFFMIILFIFLV